MRSLARASDSEPQDIDDCGLIEASVVIPTFNRRDWLQRLLLALEGEYENETHFEVIVVVDGATDGTIDMLAQLHTNYKLRVLTQLNSGPAAARNRGLAAASGDVVIFLDDDVVPVEDLIASHTAVHRRDRDAAVLGRIAARPQRIRTMTPWAGHEMELLKRHYAALESGRVTPGPRHFFTANASVRRNHLLAVGGFDENFRRSEDVELGYRLAERGLQFHFVSGATVFHESDHELPEWLSVPYKYGCQDVVMAREHGRPTALEYACQEWHTRHILTRVVAHWCVGHRWRRRLVLGVIGRLIRFEFPGVLFRVQMAMCGALFNVEYWQGLADATGFGTNVWRGLRDRTPVVHV